MRTNESRSHKQVFDLLKVFEQDKAPLKGLFTDNRGFTEPFPAQKYNFNFFGSFCDTDLSNRALQLLLEHFGPIRDTIKSTVEATGIERLKNA